MIEQRKPSSEEVILLARDFSPYPAGRYRKDGPFSGEAFLEDRLMPVIAKKGRAVVNIDGVAGLPSSFWEEVFGGLRVFDSARDSVREFAKLTAGYWLHDRTERDHADEMSILLCQSDVLIDVAAVLSLVLDEHKVEIETAIDELIRIGTGVHGAAGHSSRSPPSSGEFTHFVALEVPGVH